MSLKTHNILDYLGGILLLFVPAVFGFSGLDAARNVFIFSGAGLILYSLLTRYELALWRVIPLAVHMSLDVLIGVIVMLAPWIFGYRSLLTTGQEVLHYAIALGLYAMVAFTRPKSESEATGVSGSTIFTDTGYGSQRDRRAG